MRKFMAALTICGVLVAPVAMTGCILSQDSRDAVAAGLKQEAPPPKAPVVPVAPGAPAPASTGGMATYLIYLASLAAGVVAERVGVPAFVTGIVANAVKGTTGGGHGLVANIMDGMHTVIGGGEAPKA